MNLTCLVPTYGRPRLVANAVALFERQRYPADQRRMLILDDADQIAPQARNGWQVISTPNRYPSLPAKYAALIEADAGWADAFVVWDDDDVYLPWHLTVHARVLTDAGWSRPSFVLSDAPNRPEPVRERVVGGFHAALAVTRRLLDQVGGWGDTLRADFDQQLLGRLRAIERPGDTLCHGEPSFVFRWSRTGAVHSQELIDTPSSQSWYGRMPRSGPSRVEQLIPALDADTQRLLAMLAGVVPDDHDEDV